ncbi:MAG: VWA domain-containing protein [Acidobacteria bacterium]|nr:VWA domain-containing protein [Acidobacteriota bacterium]
MTVSAGKVIVILGFLLGFSAVAAAQELTRRAPISTGMPLDVVNRYGRVAVVTDVSLTAVIQVNASSSISVAESELSITTSRNAVAVAVAPADAKKRIDIRVTIPEGLAVRVATIDGAVDLLGSFSRLDVSTDTGTIAADLATDNITYNLQWTRSRPRYMSDLALNDVKERSAGRFEIKGQTSEASGKKKKKDSSGGAPTDKADAGVTLNATTERGIILLNVPPDQVASDLRDRPLTNAAKAIVRSGDSLLMDAIRKAAPKYYGDYARSLPPIKMEPRFSSSGRSINVPAAAELTALVRATDLKNRAVAGLSKADFEVTESGTLCEVLAVEPSEAPVNLVLLLDVSGSVENYTTFIRKAAREFISTMDNRDRIAIVIFNDDVKVLAAFTTDKGRLSESLDSFDAGGGTAYYDALAYVIADTLRSLKGGRSAIVILSDGDDNRSFLSFRSLLGSIQESGSLIYPLYVPSGLIAASQAGATIDPLRARYLGLSAKSDGEGRQLAQISGGVYYSISRLSEIQAAYEDIVSQLRTAYNVMFRCPSANSGSKASPRLKAKVKRENIFATITSVAESK